jgi:hypothetical protein
MNPAMGAIRAAAAIMDGRGTMQTSYGLKTEAGLADLIEQETGASDLLEACKNAIKIIDGVVNPTAVSHILEAIETAEGRILMMLDVYIDDRSRRYPFYIWWRTDGGKPEIGIGHKLKAREHLIIWEGAEKFLFATSHPADVVCTYGGGVGRLIIKRQRKDKS